MTLPRGFGKGWDYEDKPKEEIKHCKLGKPCGDSRRSMCGVHHWVWYHDEAWIALRVLGIIACIVGVIFLMLYISHQESLPIKESLQYYTCPELAQYIADKQSEYTYAEHRYEWLCVNEKIKEFQG